MVTTYLRSIYKSFAMNIVDVPPRLLALLCFLLLVSFPITRPSAFLLFVLTSTNIMAIFATSWDLLVGRTGQMSLGHALFFGIGAYTTALLYKFYGLPLLVTIPAAMLMGVLVAVLVGFPSLRVKGPFLALISMSFPLILTSLVFYFGEWTGGENGIWGLPSLFPMKFFTERGFPYFEALYQQKVAQYYLTLLLLLVSAIILYKIANSRTGIVFVSVLDDELASKACGINVTKYKLMAFAISALFASLAGGVYAHFITSIGPMGTLSVTLSFTPVIMTIFGGIGTIYGPVAATFIITILDMYVLRRIVDVPLEWHPLIFMIIVVIFIVKWPRGVARFVTDKLEDLAEERELEERGPH
ncbi:MAG: branched-chain amino acid ABC transporter permease, partial [bacterium]